LVCVFVIAVFCALIRILLLFQLKGHVALAKQERDFLRVQMEDAIAHPEQQTLVLMDCSASIELPHFFPNVCSFILVTYPSVSIAVVLSCRHAIVKRECPCGWLV
jgi:hypothetical protein